MKSDNLKDIGIYLRSSAVKYFLKYE